jgi:hypothetical protein
LSEWENTVLQWAFKANSALATAEKLGFKRPYAMVKNYNFLL